MQQGRLQTAYSDSKTTTGSAGLLLRSQDTNLAAGWPVTV